MAGFSYIIVETALLEVPRNMLGEAASGRCHLAVSADVDAEVDDGVDLARLGRTDGPAPRCVSRCGLIGMLSHAFCATIDIFFREQPRHDELVALLCGRRAQACRRATSRLISFGIFVISPNTFLGLACNGSVRHARRPRRLCHAFGLTALARARAVSPIIDRNIRVSSARL